MKRSLSTLATTILLLGLGAMAYMASPSNVHNAVAANPIAQDVSLTGSAAPAPAPDESAPVEAMAASQAANAELNWKDIALPLTVETIVDAQSLANGLPGPQNILLWNAAGQSFFFYVPDPVYPGGLGDHPDFANGNYSLQTGDSLLSSQTRRLMLVFPGWAKCHPRPVAPVPWPTAWSGPVRVSGTISWSR